MTRLLWVSITETVSEDWLATYSFLPSGVSAHPNGSAPTLTLVVAFRCAASMTLTRPETMFVTYTTRSFGAIATHCGSLPTGICWTSWTISLLTEMSETESFCGFATHRNRLSLVIAMGAEWVACGDDAPNAAGNRRSRAALQMLSASAATTMPSTTTGWGVLMN